MLSQTILCFSRFYIADIGTLSSTQAASTSASCSTSKQEQGNRFPSQDWAKTQRKQPGGRVSRIQGTEVKALGALRVNPTSSPRPRAKRALFRGRARLTRSGSPASPPTATRGPGRSAASRLRDRKYSWGALFPALLGPGHPLLT